LSESGKSAKFHAGSGFIWRIPAKAESWRVVVDNRPGVLHSNGLAEVLKQPADGYSILAMSAVLMAAPVLLQNKELRLDIDLAPVVRIATSHNVLAVIPSFPATSMSELTKVLKSQPDKFNLSAGAFGTPGHLVGELFKLQTGVRVAVVHYPQPQQRMADLLNGTVVVTAQGSGH
jgi:tripartite-type tricarboxylate transporter receptor subunit TctC